MTGAEQTTIIRARHVVAHQRGRHVLLDDGEVVVRGVRIESVGPRTGRSDADEVIDLGDAVMLPGLIDLDAVTDIDHLQLDSWASPDTATGFLWSQEYTARAHHVFTAEERRTIRRFGLAQLARHGVTTFMPIAAETYSEWAEDAGEMIAMAEDAKAIGLRGFLGPSYRSGVVQVMADGQSDVHFDRERGLWGLDQARRFLDYAREEAHPLIEGVLLPARIETQDDEVLRGTAQLSRERNALVRIHALQNLKERDLMARHHGGGALEVLERTSLLNERLLVAHALLTDRHSRVATGDIEIPALVAAGASIVHCPLTSFRYGIALESFSGYRAAGLNIALGSDSFPPDLIRGMDVGVHLAKIVDGRRDTAPAAHYLEAATLGGAAALRRPDLGRLQAGAAADIAAFSLADFAHGVVDDPVRTLLLAGTARDAVLTMVAGRTVLRNGDVAGVDTARLAREADALFAKMKDSFTERDHRHRPTAELFPPSFPAFTPEETG